MSTISAFYVACVTRLRSVLFSQTAQSSVDTNVSKPAGRHEAKILAKLNRDLRDNPAWRNRWSDQ